MFRGGLIRIRDGVIHMGDDYDATRMIDRLAGDDGGGQSFELALNFGGYGFGKRN